MNAFLLIQIIAFVAFVVIVIDLALSAVAKRIVPAWSRGACTLIAGFIIASVLFATVPGRTRHFNYVKQLVSDELAERTVNSRGTGLWNCLGNAFIGWTTGLALQGMRIERPFGLMSIGFIETDSGWRPVSIGFAGIVCSNFFLWIPSYPQPPVIVAKENDGMGVEQVSFSNMADTSYTCEAFSQATNAAPLCKFELGAGSTVRIQQEKKGLRNKLKDLLHGDKSLVKIVDPLTSVSRVTFRAGRQLYKQVELKHTDEGLKEYWKDPK